VTCSDDPRIDRPTSTDLQIRRIIDAVSDAIIVMDANERIYFANPAAEALFGVPTDTLHGRLFAFPVTAGQMTDVNISRVDGVRIAEMRTVETVWDTRPVLAVSLRDVTEQRTAENNLRVAYKRHATANNELQHADQVKNQFLATMSHEIRTPISGIIGITGLLLETQLDPAQRDYAQDIRNSSEILLTLINDILDISKIEAEKLELEDQPFELMTCVDEAVDLISRKVLEKGLELHCEVKGELPCAFIGDVTRLRQILLNLLSNAAKFTESGAITVSVSGTQRNEMLYELHFAVRDTGIGIPADLQNRLFQSFSQADRSTARKFGGTGLGLAISKRLAELMGGKMWVESTGVPGEGATLHFTVVAAAAKEQELSDMRAEGLKCLIDKRVLIVDKKPARGKVIASQVARWLMTSVATNSITKAIRLLEAGDPFDIVLVDLPTLPNDHTSPAGKMLDVAAAQNIPIVTLTSQLKIGKHSVIASQLVRPVSQQRLCNTLCDILSARTHRRPDKSEYDKADSPACASQHIRILLAEDSPVNQKVAQRMLAKLGYRADLVSNGREAVRAAQHIPYDVILMDCQMPEINGYEATCQIRQSEKGVRHRPAHIIAMTAMVMEGDREKCIAAGMDEYLSKPVRAHELQQALERLWTESSRPIPPN
jgi:signal transduction histidine kinase/two-component SAPR family response regulator